MVTVISGLFCMPEGRPLKQLLIGMWLLENRNKFNCILETISVYHWSRQNFGMLIDGSTESQVPQRHAFIRCSSGMAETSLTP